MNGDLTVLFEDNHILAVLKPPGLLSQGDRTGDPTMVDWAKAYLKEKYHKPGEVYLGLIHRLDRPTGGVLLLARTSKAAKRLSAQFQSRTVKKRYLAVCEGLLSQTEGECVHYLRFDEKKRRSLVVNSRVKGAQKASLRYSVLATQNNRSLLRVELLTGRKHQIRAQLAALGHPIVGDRKYSGGTGRSVVKSFGLWAYHLTCEHPVRKVPLELLCLPPTEGEEPWLEFSSLLSSLPAG